MIDYTPAINQYYEAIQYQDASAAEISSWSALLNGSTTVAEMQTAIINDPYTLNVVDPVDPRISGRIRPHSGRGRHYLLGRPGCCEPGRAWHFERDVRRLDGIL